MTWCGLWAPVRLGVFPSKPTSICHGVRLLTDFIDLIIYMFTQIKLPSSSISINLLSSSCFLLIYFYTCQLCLYFHLHWTATGSQVIANYTLVVLKCELCMSCEINELTNQKRVSILVHRSVVSSLQIINNLPLPVG